MIIDRLERLETYSGLPPRLLRALRALRDTDVAQRSDGRYEFEGSDVFALVQSYPTRTHDKCHWESHEKYIDIQYISDGAECMGFADVQDMTVRDPYDDDHDVTMYQESKGSLINMPAGTFVIFFPQDVHKPCMAVNQPEPVRKTVFKVRVD